MKTYFFAVAVVAVIVLVSMMQASCVKSSLKAMGSINVALTGGR